MELLDLFKYEGKEERKYLVYEKREADILDTFTLEMLSNNKIEGLASFSSIRLDQEVTMKYNVTGKTTLRELFAVPIRREKFLGILRELIQTLLRAEDYMLDVSSYILDESFIYIDPADLKVFMIVLPIKREAEKAELFFKKLLFDVKYDQTEDCSYVASLMNCLGNESTFSLRSFCDQVIRFEKTPFPEKKRESREPSKKEIPNKIYHIENNSEFPAIEHGSHSLEKKRNLDIVFSDYEEEPEKKKKGFFSKKDKREKKEKKGFFGKKKEKNEDLNGDENIPGKSPLGEIAIPGMDLIGRLQAERKENEESDDRISSQRQQIPIPAQRVTVEQKAVDQQDFGETVYMDEDAEAPTEFEEEKKIRQGFVLYRCSTQETFEIKGDVVRVGRSPSISEICISGNRGVGRVHAVLYVRGGQVYILDNNSKNKTYVDGKELKPDQPVMLLSGSKIRLGTEELEFRISR